MALKGPGGRLPLLTDIARHSLDFASMSTSAFIMVLAAKMTSQIDHIQNEWRREINDENLSMKFNFYQPNCNAKEAILPLA